MDFILSANNADYQIQSYEAGMLIINQQTYTTSVFVSAKNVQLWRPQQLSDLTLADLEPLVALNADVILLGVGVEMCFLKPELRTFIADQRLPLEVMTTKAACRTFQVLTSEQRLIYAALFV